MELKEKIGKPNGVREEVTSSDQKHGTGMTVRTKVPAYLQFSTSGGLEAEAGRIKDQLI